jgi:hypothetical protein
MVRLETGDAASDLGFDVGACQSNAWRRSTRPPRRRPCALASFCFALTDKRTPAPPTYQRKACAGALRPASSERRGAPAGAGVHDCFDLALGAASDDCEGDDWMARS